MKIQSMLGGFAIAWGFMGAEARAQEHVAALDPSLATSSTEAADPGQPHEVAPPAEGTAPVAPASPAPPAAAEPPASSSATPAATATTEPLISVGAAPRAKEADAPGPSSASQLPIRARRKLALLGEVGWNGLGGWGLMMTYNAHPHLAFDVAGGFSLVGWKAGLRGRYNLLTGPFTPFVGAGLSMASGMDEARLTRRDRDESRDRDWDFDPERDAKYDVKRSEYAQAVLGFEFIHRHGFTLQAAAGYSWLLNKNNYTLVEGKAHDKLASAIFGSGPVATMAFGYSFN